jgi:hypothetical protein
MSGSFSLSLVAVFTIWAVACLGLAAVFPRRAPAMSLALGGSVLGAVAGFLVGNADGPAGVPASTAVGASLGLFLLGVAGLLTTSPRAPSRSLRLAALLVLLVMPLGAAALTILLQVSCPLYISGKGSGFCNFRGTDVLGGWVTNVIAAFVVDALFVAVLLLVSAWQADVRMAGSAVGAREVANSEGGQR